MKNCKKCGSVINDNDICCSNCGQKAKKEFSKAGKIFLVSTIVIFLLLVTIGAFIFINASRFEYKADLLLANQQYEEAILLANQYIDKNGEKEEYKNLINECNYFIGKQYFENNEYIKAYNYLHNNNYSEAIELIKEVEPLYYSQVASDDIINNYNTMLDDISKQYENENTMEQLTNSHYDGSQFYLNIGMKLDQLMKAIDNDKDINDFEDVYNDIFGFLPKDNKEAKELIEDLQKTVIWDINEYHLYYVMNYITDSDYIAITEENGQRIIEIEHPDKFLEDKKITAKTFAYILGVPKEYGLKIEQDTTKIKLICYKGSRLYGYCSIGTNNEELNKSIADGLVDILNDFDNFEYVETKDGYDYYEVRIKNTWKVYFEYVDFTIIFYDDNNTNIFGRDYLFIENIGNGDINLKFKVNNKYSDFYYEWYILWDLFI